MAETYCGRTCADCSQKEVLQCPGCRQGPGRPYSGECELAQCVRTSKQETCGTCTQKGSCRLLRESKDMPAYRRTKAAAEAYQAARNQEKAQFLGKWLWLLFWLILPGTLAGLMTNSSTTALVPGLKVPGEILSVLVSVARGLILIKLSSEEKGYGTAGACTLIAAVGSALLAVLPGAPWTLLLSIPAALVSLAGIYNEFTAHASVLQDVDEALSSKWRTLFKWEIGLLAVTLGSIFFMLISALLAVMTAWVCTIGSIVVSVLQLIYLYRTAKVFRDRCAEPI